MVKSKSSDSTKTTKRRGRPPKKPLAGKKTSGKQPSADTNISFEIDYEVVDSIEVGTGLRLRLGKYPGKDKYVVQSWSSMQKKWTVMHRYDVISQWNGWKRLEQSIKN